MLRRMLLPALALFAAGAQSDDPKTIRILIVTGYDHPVHQWKESTPALRNAFESDARLLVRVVEDPGFLESKTLHEYDAIVLHFMNWKRKGPGEDARDNLKTFVEGGKGLILIHFACGLFAEWPEFEKIAGRVWDRKNTHDPRGPFRVNIVGGDHPVARGMESYDTDDELYICLTGDRPITLLASARSRVTGRDHPMAFSVEYGKGRVFHTTLGHDARAIRNPGTAALVRRGAEWAATGKVR